MKNKFVRCVCVKIVRLCNCIGVCAFYLLLFHDSTTYTSQERHLTYHAANDWWQFYYDCVYSVIHMNGSAANTRHTGYMVRLWYSQLVICHFVTSTWRFFADIQWFLFINGSLTTRNQTKSVLNCMKIQFVSNEKQMECSSINIMNMFWIKVP